MSEPALKLLQPEALPRVAAKPDRTGDLARLAALHAEAEETARLANLLGRSPQIATALTLATAIAAFALGDIGSGATIAWLVLGVAGAAALALAYMRTIRAPFERLALLSFREDLKAVLLYAGFAWGAGGWLALPYDASAAAVIAFAAIPVGAIAALVRDRDAAFIFGVPVTGLVSFASVLRPFSDAALDAGLILIACGAIGAAVLAADRLVKPAKSLPFFKEIQA
jgi:hypothetical protein